MKRHWFLLPAAAAVAALVGAAAVIAQAPGPSAGTLLASGLSTTGTTIGPDGALYVALGGSGGATEIALPEEMGGGSVHFGLTGSVARVDPGTGEVTTAAENLPSIAFGEGPGEAGGAADVAFLGGRMFALITGGANYLGGAASGYPNGVYGLNDDGSWDVIADLSAFNDDNPVEFPDATPGGNPFSMTVRGNEFIVADGNYNRVLTAGLDGSVSVLAAFDNVVPTGTESQASGPVYVTWFSAFPHTAGSGLLQQIGFPTGNVVELASGTQLIDVEFGPGGKLYVLSMGDPATDPEGPPAVPFSGEILLVNDDGTLSTVVDGLLLPTALEFAGDTAFVSGLAGDVYKIENVSSLEPLAPAPAPQPATAPAPAPTKAAGVITAPNTGTGTGTAGDSMTLWFAIALGVGGAVAGGASVAVARR